MSTNLVPSVHENRGSLARIQRVIDRISLGLIYAVVIAVAPLAAVGLLNRTV